jgi:amino-acid N-acetyltransferase
VPTTIEAATAADLDALAFRLSQATLPVAGFAEHLASTLVARADGDIVGGVALELYGEEALLRSLVVSPTERGAGLGERLTTAALELARARGARRVWLLTTTAERFFPRFGFRVVERSALPAVLGASAELRGACPASAVAMGVELAPTAVERALP